MTRMNRVTRMTGMTKVTGMKRVTEMTMDDWITEITGDDKG